MPENKLFPPEGLRPPAEFTMASLKEAAERHQILEAVAQRCGPDHTLHFSLDGIAGEMPRSQAVAPWVSGAGREIAVLSRVGRPTCFTVTALRADAKGAPVAPLSRREAQDQAMDHFLSHLVPGMVLVCRVTRLERFGVFLDVGCGIAAMLPIERISVSRISHPAQRFREGQKILAAVYAIDRDARRLTMTHRELLGTWMENASRFCPGETVRGVVRGIQPYGSFIELTPNLSGLAENRQDLAEGDQVSVFIKSIRPESMKLKLQVVERLGPAAGPETPVYQVTDGQLERWVYSPPGCVKTVETVFTSP